MNREEDFCVQTLRMSITEKNWDSAKVPYASLCWLA